MVYLRRDKKLVRSVCFRLSGKNFKQILTALPNIFNAEAVQATSIAITETAARHQLRQLELGREGAGK
jgi:hypothetical protein